MKTDDFKPWPDTRSSVLRAVHDIENQPAWERYYDLYAAYIYHLARQSQLQKADANEIVQTVILETGQKLAQGHYDSAKGKFRAWLKTCTLNRIRDMQRKHGRLANHEKQVINLDEEQTEWLSRQSDPQSDAFEEMAENEWRERVIQLALQKLRAQISDKSFEIFHAYVLEEWPVEQVMKTYNVSRDLVYQTKKRTGTLFATLARQAEEELDAPNFST